jgi:hypothetical protein
VSQFVPIEVLMQSRQIRGSGFVDLAFTSCSHQVLHSIRQVRVCGFSPWILGETPPKIKGQVPHLNNSKSVWKRRVYTLWSTKNYLFYFSLFLPRRSGVYMNRKYSYISTGLFIKWLTLHFLKHQPSGKNFLLLDGHRAHCSSPWLLQAAVENDVTIISLPSHCTRALPPLGKFFWAFKESFKKWSRSLDGAESIKENKSISCGAPHRVSLE